jgi:hypothetical protein
LFKKVIQKAYDLNLTFYTARDLSKWNSFPSYYFVLASTTFP